MTTLTAALPRDRRTIVNRATRYAVECIIDGRCTVIGYAVHTSRASLLKAARNQADAIMPFLTESDTCHYRNGVLTLGARVILRFGETERQMW